MKKEEKVKNEKKFNSWKIYKRLLSYLRNYKLYLILALIFSIFYAIFSGFSLGMILPIFDRVFTRINEPIEYTNENIYESVITVLNTTWDKLWQSDNGYREAFDYARISLDEILITSPPLKVLKFLCVIIFFILLFKNLALYFHKYYMVYIEQGIVRDLRNALYTQLQYLSLHYYHKTKTGELISRVVYDVTLIQYAVGEIFSVFVQESFLAVMYLILAIWASWKLFLIAPLVFAPSMLLIHIIGKALRQGSTSLQVFMAELTSLLQETISGIRVVKAFAMEKFDFRIKL